jgi:hypothetical protein
VKSIFVNCALLVRPDKHIGRQSHRLADNPEQALSAAVSAILSRKD